MALGILYISQETDFWILQFGRNIKTSSFTVKNKDIGVLKIIPYALLTSFYKIRSNEIFNNCSFKGITISMTIL